MGHGIPKSRFGSCLCASFAFIDTRANWWLLTQHINIGSFSLIILKSVWVKCPPLPIGKLQITLVHIHSTVFSEIKKANKWQSSQIWTIWVCGFSHQLLLLSTWTSPNVCSHLNCQSASISHIRKLIGGSCVCVCVWMCSKKCMNSKQYVSQQTKNLNNSNFAFMCPSKLIPLDKIKNEKQNIKYIAYFRSGTYLMVLTECRQTLILNEFERMN